MAEADPRGRRGDLLGHLYNEEIEEREGTGLNRGTL